MFITHKFVSINLLKSIKFYFSKHSEMILLFKANNSLLHVVKYIKCDFIILNIDINQKEKYYRRNLNISYNLNILKLLNTQIIHTLLFSVVF